MKAIIFDLDGVIVDTENTVWHQSSVELINMYGKVHEEERVKPLLMGCKFEEGTKILYSFYDIKDSFKNFLENRRKLVRKGFAERVEFMEGFLSFLNTLKGRNKAIATSMDNEFLTLTMDHLPLQTLFGKHIYPVSLVSGKGKPNPAIFLHAAKKINENPSNCIVIEDAPKGISAAKNAGMRSIALTTSVPREHLTHADYIVDSFAHISRAMLS